MTGPGVHQRAEHDLTPTGRVLFPTIQDGLHLLALQPILAATQIARDDRIVHGMGKSLTIRFGNMGKGTIEEQVAFFMDQLLPANMSLRVGRYLADFGKWNTISIY